MSEFLEIIIKILPIYLYAFLGFIANKYLKVEAKSLAKVVIYILNPIVVFNGIINVNLNLSTIALPIAVYLSGVIVILSSYYLTRKFFDKKVGGVMAFSSSLGNYGFFGIPVAAAILGSTGEAILIVGAIGAMIFQDTFGYWFLARSKFSIKDAFKKVFTLPSIYAAILATILNFSGLDVFKFNQTYLEVAQVGRANLIFLGMMIIGIGVISGLKEIDWKFIGWGLLFKFVFYPLLTLVIIFLDRLTFGLFDKNQQDVLFLLSLTPVAATVTIYATQFNLTPQKAAAISAVSLLLALLIVPLGMFFWLDVLN